MAFSPSILSTSASVLAAAIYETFPGSELLGGGDTRTGFFYQFIPSYSLPPEALTMVEERMRQIIRENRPIRLLDMVACSARGLFAKQGHRAAIDALEELEPKALVSVVQIGPFVDLMEGPCCSSVRDMGAFKLTSLQELQDREYRIEGCAFQTKDELKTFLKCLAQYSSGNHLSAGSLRRFWSVEEGEMVWLPQGLKIRSELIAWLQKNLGSEEVRASSEEALDRYGLARAKREGNCSLWTVIEKTENPSDCLDGGLFEASSQTVAEQIIYCKEGQIDEFAISLLQKIGKTLIILGFNPELCLASRRKGDRGVKWFRDLLNDERVNLSSKSSPLPFEVDETISPKTLRVSWRVQDGLGRVHPAIELDIEQKESPFIILRAKVGVERILSFLLEQSDGKLNRKFTFEN